MIELFENGHAADIILAVLALEAAWLRLKGTPVGEIILVLTPAMLMVLGLRFALTGAAWYWIALPLAASFPVHLLDLRRRGLIGPR